MKTKLQKYKEQQIQIYREKQRYNFCGLIVKYKAAQVLFKYYQKIGKVLETEELEDYAIGI